MFWSVQLSPFGKIWHLSLWFKLSIHWWHLIHGQYSEVLEHDKKTKSWLDYLSLKLDLYTINISSTASAVKKKQLLVTLTIKKFEYGKSRSFLHFPFHSWPSFEPTLSHSLGQSAHTQNWDSWLTALLSNGVANSKFLVNARLIWKEKTLKKRVKLYT